MKTLLFTAIGLVSALTFSSSGIAKTIFENFPNTINADEKYVFYSHGYIVEGTNPTPVNPRWGVYDFPSIKKALADESYNLIAYHRPKDTKPRAFAKKLSANVQTLLSAGVKANNITFIGFSRGGAITALTSNYLANDDINFVILAGCSRFIKKNPTLAVYGHIRSIFETSDGVGSCQFLIDRSNKVNSFEEIAINTGKEHGAFYLPRAAWVAPVKQWIAQQSAPKTKKPAKKKIIEKITAIEQQYQARIGAAVYDIANDDLWSYHGEQRFPLMSTFKTLACAKLFADAESGIQSLETSYPIKADSLITWSPITEDLIGQQLTLQAACAATMLTSDNTAANIILEGINGPKALTKFLRRIGDNTTRIDRIEPELNEATPGDDRDTTTPIAMAKTMKTIFFDNLLTEKSTAQLKQWMSDNQITTDLLRSALPEGWSIADRSGAGGNGSRAMTAITWSKEHTPLIIAVYVTQLNATIAVRNKVIADIGHEIFSVYNQ